ncbi:MAG: ABC transporter permease [Clostridiaceae bacterium]|nr:ABC transporter permease [Clostridiaceae bacterium]
MLKYFFKRLLVMIPMMLAISLLVFGALELTPGDPLTAQFPPDQLVGMSQEDLDALREAVGLNDPMLVRYFRWLIAFFTGDMGYSIQTGTPISQVISYLLPQTVILAAAALLISTIFGLIFGIIAATKHNTIWDYLASVIGVIGISMPEFFIGIVAILIFAINLGWLPAQGRGSADATFIQNLRYLILPASSLGLSLAAALTRYTRNSMMDVMNQDYVKTARAKGLSESRVFFKHVFRNALMPISVLIFLRLPMLIGGSVVIEQVFGYAGIGNRLLTAINSSDYQLVLTIILMLSFVALLASLLIDLVTALLDPRVRL